MPHSTQVPEVGQLVEVRRRRFVVSDLTADALPSAAPSALPRNPQHLVKLNSVEDDALGEELEVIWELEPGAIVHPRASLPEPTGFDDPQRLDAFLDAVRWGAVSSADVRSLQAPSRSGIEIEDYQLDPVARAIQMPRVNLLIADDVGLGKTIEAGLVVQELLLRHRARRILVVCPASLQVQWIEQMRDKFGLEFRIVDTACQKELRRERGLDANPWSHFPRLVTSIDYLKRERPKRQFQDTLHTEKERARIRPWDLLILDEAHNAAPPQGGNYPIYSLRTQLIAEIAPQFEHRLFLTATPHNGYRESFTALLSLLDPQRFVPSADLNQEQLAAVMIRRMKSDLELRWDGTRLFAERGIEPIEITYPDAERQAHAALATYTRLRLEGAKDSGERYATEFVLKLLKKRLFSSPAAFRVTLEKHLDALRGRHRSDRAGGGDLARRRLGRRVAELDEEAADDEGYEIQSSEVMDEASQMLRPPSPAEQALLDQLLKFARDTEARGDAKSDAFLDWLDKTVRPGGKWGDTRVIIFTEYRATQKWLQGLMATRRLSGDDRLEVIYGGMKSDDREHIKNAFQAAPSVARVRILLATDAASEGINLQNHCSRLVHYEIPWNPNRMEQRNGRVDRFGQKDKVQIFHFVGAGWRTHEGDAGRDPGDVEGDLEFLFRAARKINTIREDLGKVGPVIAQQVEEAMLGKRRRLDTHAAEQDATAQRAFLRVEREIKKKVEQLAKQLDETQRDLHLNPENVHAVVATALELAGQPPLQPVLIKGVTIDPNRPASRCGAFRVPALDGSWARTLANLPHPHTQEVRPIVFDHSLAEGRDDVVLVHLSHPLAQAAMRLLRSEVWSTSAAKRLHRVTARLLTDPTFDAPVLVAHARLVVLGTDSARLHEELVTAGGRLREGRFARMGVGELDAALAAASPTAVPPTACEKLVQLWPEQQKALLAALEARVRDRQESLQKQLAERADIEVAHLNKILDDLELTIRAALEGPGPTQLVLWTDDERQYRQRDIDLLQGRLAELPTERQRDTEELRRRFAAPTARLFPVSVTWLVPEKIARSLT